MNRSLAYVGVAVVVAGLSLVASPVVMTGRMTLDLAPIAGLVVSPVGLMVVALGAAAWDPKKTTVHGVFGGDAASPIPEFPAQSPGSVPVRFGNPKAPVHCPHCRTIMTYELARCPRCARERPCRNCGRPLTAVEERATCPHCSREELFCNCSQYGVAVQRMGVGRTILAR